MKIHRLLLISIFTMSLYGDVMYEMSTTTVDAMGAGNSESMIRTFIKQDYSRTEITVQNELTGPIVNTYIVRLDKKEIWVLDPENKEYTIIPLAEEVKGAGAEVGKDTASMVPEVTVRCLEEKKTILEVECQKYIISLKIDSPDDKVTLTQTMWVGKDVPGYEEIGGFNKRLVALAGSIAQQGIGAIDKQLFQEFQEKISGIDGFPLEIDMEFSMPMEGMDFDLKTHSEVNKVSIVPISDKVFEIPEGYVQKKD